MSRAEEYRRNAEETDRRARRATSPLDREAYEKIAREWRALAAGARKPGPQ